MASPSPTTPADRPTSHWWRLTWGDLGRALIAVLGAAIGIEIASWIVPGFDVGGWGNSLVVAINVFVWGIILRPLLVRLAVLLGAIGTLLIGLFGQAAIIFVAVWDVDGENDVTVFSALVASWIVAAVSTLLTYLATAGTDDAVTASFLRRARRRTHKIPDPEVDGILFVQADGVPWPVLEWCVRAGTLPTLSRWIRTGTHQMAEWRPKLPATTPASQMGILHGTIEGIPAFRWVDRAEGRVYVANKPADAKVIEANHSDGRGLLADDGVSVSNLFTGDAPWAYATMSAMGRSQETKETRMALSQFLGSPVGLSRSIPKLVAEVVQERFQSRRAIRRDIRPRVHRGWGFVGERAALTGVLRDVNTAMVADAMLKGRRSIYVDYVDYDAVAHHAGVLRPESMAALEGIDAVLAQLEQVAAVAPRKYHLVVLSDHGQSQGAVFADRYGEDLATLVSRLADADVVAAGDNHEGVGSLNAVIAGSSSDDTVLGRALGRTSDRVSEGSLKGAHAAAGVDQRAPPAPEEAEGADRFIVFGSGNLGLVYVAGEKHRLTLTELTERFPALVPGLVAHDGVSFAVVDTADHGPVVIGKGGEHRVRTGEVVGNDPLAGFGDHAPEFVLRAASMSEAPDIYVNSLVDDLGEVAAFEGLVGCHGGRGGWQDRAMIGWPSELPGPEEMIVGADAVHRQLVGWLEQLGHRTELREAAAGATPAQDQAGR
jgi:hypothetical protein